VKKAFTLILIFNLLFSLMGVAEYAHYCCDKMSSEYFTAPSCCCDEEEDGDCCKDEVTIVQLKQDGVSEKTPVIKPTITPILFTAHSDIYKDNSPFITSHAFLSRIERNYESPPFYIKNRMLLI
jgi:hypothetical protein